MGDGSSADYREYVARHVAAATTPSSNALPLARNPKRIEFQDRDHDDVIIADCAWNFCRDCSNCSNGISGEPVRSHALDPNQCRRAMLVVPLRLGISLRVACWIGHRLDVCERQLFSRRIPDPRDVISQMSGFGGNVQAGLPARPVAATAAVGLKGQDQ